MTNSVEQRPSSKADSFLTSREIPRILWNPKVHYRVQNSLPFLPILSHIDPVRFVSLNPISWLYSVVLFFHPRLVLPSILLPFSSNSCLGLPSGLQPSGLLARTYIMPLCHTCQSGWPMCSDDISPGWLHSVGHRKSVLWRQCRFITTLGPMQK
jgi:hypothetical protein